ncbi:Com family DNA-binding transcriptional regulator [Rhodopseudomonas rhenobacensis]|uniref:Com family DNA-binding transcriptional regulator n=1 Tax=Rhodopseudomonas rhenobacensis TaxID=87461 RepID=UPI00160BC0EB
MESIRCARCRALLFRAVADAIVGTVEIKCRRCGGINILRPTEPSTERHERPTSGEALCSSSDAGSVRQPYISETPSKSFRR